MTVMVPALPSPVVSRRFRFVSIHVGRSRCTIRQPRHPDAEEPRMNATLLKRLIVLGLSGHCVLALATATGTQTEAVDCSQVPGTQATLNACAFQDFESATAAYSAAYKTLSQSVGNQQRKLLRQVQTEWIQYRVKACEFEKSGVEGGSAAPMINWQCQARMTRERTAELQRFLDCKEGDLSCVRQPK
jgi:uncharacterized protein YecT (DUF1311 family)